jgi:hypothetical protein
VTKAIIRHFFTYTTFSISSIYQFCFRSVRLLPLVKLLAMSNKSHMFIMFIGKLQSYFHLRVNNAHKCHTFWEPELVTAAVLYLISNEILQKHHRVTKVCHYADPLRPQHLHRPVPDKYFSMNVCKLPKLNAEKHRDFFSLPVWR